jgi:hypothetical protein
MAYRWAIAGVLPVPGAALGFYARAFERHDSGDGAAWGGE